MSNATSFGVVEATTAATPTIYNITSPGTANTEFSQALSSNTKRFNIKVRGGSAVLKFSFTATESGTKFITVPKGNDFEETGLNLVGKTLYMQVDKPSQVIELLEWV